MSLSLVPPTDYSKLQRICAPLDNHLAVAAILAGETPAQVYVDDVASPTVALLLPWNGHRVFLAGATNDQRLIADIRELLRAARSSPSSLRNPSDFLIYYVPSTWEANLAVLCQGMETTPAMRQYYTLAHAPPDWQRLLPATWQLRRVDAGLLAEHELKYLPELIEEVHAEAPSREDFLAHKFGYCLQEDQTLIGWCLSEYNHADRCEVGIATAPEYRRRGGAFILASALIAHALEVRITHIGWHCWSRNTASSLLAQKLGGSLAAEYPVRLCRFS